MLDYDKDEYNRYMTPTGTMLIAENAGIWQDVYFCIRSKVHVDDCYIKTYYKDKSLEVEADICNKNDYFLNLEVEAYIYSNDDKKHHIVVDRKKMSLSEKSITKVFFKNVYKEAVLWEPMSPNLYYIVIDIYINGKLIESKEERFGCRQI